VTSLLNQFYTEECNTYVQRIILREITERSSGKRYFTFNRFNALLDVDAGVACVEDELDAGASESVSIDELAKRLSEMRDSSLGE
jgi:hypothetical protein